METENRLSAEAPSITLENMSGVTGRSLTKTSGKMWYRKNDNGSFRFGRSETSTYSDGTEVTDVYDKNGDYVGTLNKDANGNYTSSTGDTYGSMLNAGNSSGSCDKCLDPSTVGKNYLGLSYPGPNNPKSYDRSDNYSVIPTSAAEYPAIGHDRRYDNLGATGKDGVLLDRRAIGADWRFVGEEYATALNPYANSIDRAQAFLFGTGMAFGAAYKTFMQLNTPFGAAEIEGWYNISNQGVTNNPDGYKH